MADRERKIRVLVVGTMPPPLGGCTVTLQHLVDELASRDDVELRLVDTNGVRGRGLSGARRLLGAIVRIARLAPAVDVVTLHVATTALPHWGVAVLALSRLARRPLVVRKFANTDHLRLGAVRGRIAQAVAASASVYLVETRDLVARCRASGLSHVHWFPNARPLRPAGRAVRSGVCSRFVFVGQVKREKGLVQLVEATKGLPAGVTVDVFGPRVDDLPADLFEGCPGIRYRGTLEPREVTDRISEYDALVLPTLWKHEGYPGVLIEAYAAGLPVIASRIGGIPEILDDEVGVMVEPGDVDGLRRAMLRLATDAELCATLRANVGPRAETFSTRRSADALLGLCRAAVAADA